MRVRFPYRAPTNDGHPSPLEQKGKAPYFMTPTIISTQHVDDIQAAPEIIEVARKVLEETDINVYVNPPRGARRETYIYLEKDGCVGDLEYADYVPFGYSGHFHITPSRTYGSSIGVDVDGVDEDGRTYDPDVALEMCKACLLYTSPSPRDVEESRMPSSA